MLILASKSPRRRELLGLIRTGFSVADAQADETLPAGIAPRDAALLLSQVKARAAAAMPQFTADDVIIGSDTLVALDGTILGKPHDAADAKRMLRLLSGKTHTVCTGVTVIRGAREQSLVNVTAVTFYPLTDAEIDAYVATGDPMDKAGAYGIQGVGSVLVQKIDGDFFSVMGLPVAQLHRVWCEMEA